MRFEAQRYSTNSSFLSICRRWQAVHNMTFNLPSPVLDIAFSPNAAADFHQMAIASQDVHIYNIVVRVLSIINLGSFIPFQLLTNRRDPTSVDSACSTLLILFDSHTVFDIFEMKL